MVILIYSREIVTTISELETVETTLTTTLTTSVLADISPPDSAISVIRNNWHFDYLGLIVLISVPLEWKRALSCLTPKNSLLYLHLKNSRKIKQLCSVKAQLVQVEKKLLGSSESLTGDTFRNKSRDQELAASYRNIYIIYDGIQCLINK